MRYDRQDDVGEGTGVMESSHHSSSPGILPFGQVFFKAEVL